MFLFYFINLLDRIYKVRIHLVAIEVGNFNIFNGISYWVKESSLVRFKE